MGPPTAHHHTSNSCMAGVIQHTMGGQTDPRPRPHGRVEAACVRRWRRPGGVMGLPPHASPSPPVPSPSPHPLHDDGSSPQHHSPPACPPPPHRPYYRCLGILRGPPRADRRAVPPPRPRPRLIAAASDDLIILTWPGRDRAHQGGSPGDGLCLARRTGLPLRVSFVGLARLNLCIAVGGLCPPRHISNKTNVR